MLTIDDTLGLRLPEETDISDLLSVKNDKEAALLLGRTHGEYTEDDIKKWIAFHTGREDEVVMVIVDLLTNSVIGHAGLYKIDKVSRKAEYGILIGNGDFRGRGIGKKVTTFMYEYAFSKLELQKVKAIVLSDNIASHRMLLRCGFVEEGLLKRETFKNERFYDSYLLAKFNDNPE